MAKITDNKAVFELIASDYVRRDPHWGSDLDLIMETLDKLLKKESNVKWLDIGCGPAFHLVTLGELYPEVKITGIDFSPLMLKTGKTKIGKLGIKNIALKEADVIADEIHGKYSLITFLNNGLGNLYEDGQEPKEIREAVMKKISSLLSADGYFILSVYDKEKMNLDYGSNLKLLKDESNLKNGDLFIDCTSKGKTVPYYSHWFSEEELSELAGKNNLKTDFLERRMYRFLFRCKKT